MGNTSRAQSVGPIGDGVQVHLTGSQRREPAKFSGLTRKLFSRLTGYSERAIAEWESGKEQSDSSRQRLTEIHRLQQALADVMPSEEIGSWLLWPNDALGGFKPLEVIERGEIDRIWKILYARQPEAA